MHDELMNSFSRWNLVVSQTRYTRKNLSVQSDFALPPRQFARQLLSYSKNYFILSRSSSAVRHPRLLTEPALRVDALWRYVYQSTDAYGSSFNELRYLVHHSLHVVVQYEHLHADAFEASPRPDIRKYASPSMYVHGDLRVSDFGTDGSRKPKVHGISI